MKVNKPFKGIKEFFVATADDQVPGVSVDSAMTPEEKETGAYFIDHYRIRKSELSSIFEEWQEIRKMYRCERDKTNPDPSYPNSFVSIITPVIEGQTASIVESGIEFTCFSRIPGFDAYMSILNAAGEYIREANRFTQVFKDFTRSYNLIGNAMVNASWCNEKYAMKSRPSGYPRIRNVDLEDIVIDGKITDYTDLQQAEYIIENMGNFSVMWARQEYGDEKADAIAIGVDIQQDETTDATMDHVSAFTLLHVWTRRNEYGNLQLIEMDANGLVLRMSDPKKPYYSHTFNEYPYYLARMMPDYGNLYGVGDGRMLYNAQDTVNKLTDEIELAAKFSAQSKLAVDPRGKAKISQFNSDPSKPILIENPNTNIRILQAAGINSVVFNYIQYLLEQAQRMTRYHDIMSGNMQGSSATATQVNAQLTQGNVGINDKKADIAEAMAWAYRYCLQLCLQYWDVPAWGKVGDVYTWVDLDKIKKVPLPIPTSPERITEIESAGGIANTYDIPEKDKMLGDLDFYVRVIIGKGIPKGRVDMFNMVISLLQIAAPDNNGEMKSLMSRDRAIELIEEAIGMPLSKESEIAAPQIALEQLRVNPITSGSVSQPQGSSVQTIPTNLAGTVPGVGSSDKRGML